MKTEGALKECLKQIQEILLGNVLADYECGDIEQERLMEEECPHIHSLCVYTLQLVNHSNGYDKAMAEIEKLMKMDKAKGYAGTRWLSMLAAVVGAFEDDNYSLDEEAEGEADVSSED